MLLKECVLYMKGQTYVILSIIFIIVVAVFAVTNVDTVQVRYLFWSGEAPLILVILFSVLMGCIIAAAAGVVKVFRLQRQLRRAHAENQKMEKTLRENGLLAQVEEEVKQEVTNPDKTE